MESEDLQKILEDAMVESDLFEWGIVESLFALPDKLVATAWSGHIPFLFALFRLTRPRSFVELGVHLGASLIAACSATRLYGTSTLCFGVDTWNGDEHAGDYHETGDAIYRDLNNFVSERYGFAKLFRSTFDDALKTFSDDSVDVLHIDGLHTYEAVKHDFQSWLPKLSSSGIVLFHDICVRERNFGVWKLWEEISGKYPSIEFYHSFGLGVLFVGKDQNPSSVKLIERWHDNAPFRECFRASVENVGALVPARVQAYITQDSLQRIRVDLNQAQTDLQQAQTDLQQAQTDLQQAQNELQRLRGVERAVIDMVKTNRTWRLLRPVLRAAKSVRVLERSVGR
jgi:Methyltransferase domain